MCVGVKNNLIKPVLASHLSRMLWAVNSSYLAGIATAYTHRTILSAPIIFLSKLLSGHGQNSCFRKV